MSHQALSTKVGLHLRAIGLKKTDLMSKSDPFAVLYAKDPKDISSPWKEIFRTSTVENDQNPDWPDQIVVSYQFEAMQPLKFEVYDRDSKSEKLSSHDFLGAFETSMSEIMGAIGCTISGPITKPKSKKPKGKIVITGQEVDPCADVAIFQFKASKLERKNMMGLGKADPFYVISQSQGDNQYLKVFTSETIKGTLKPVWKQQAVPVQVLANGATDREMMIEVFDWESNGKHKFIGLFHTTLNEMKTTTSFTLTNPNAKKEKDKQKSRGVVELTSFQIKEIPTFLEFIQGGLEINLMVAIDFTGSNGDPSSPSSLHHMSEGFEFTGAVDNISQFNQYQLATWSVGRILQDYDTDKNIPTFGFGGYFNNDTYHAFPLNFDPDNPEVHKVEGIMEVYKTALLTVRLSGPTYFNEILRKAIGAGEEMSATKTTQKYGVLLILTDGIINDMEKTIQSIIEGSNLPLSIIIVGVGNADFSNMDMLDGDGQLLSMRGKTAKRDIVQFVPFNEFFKKGPTILAEEVLKEVPGQVVDYFTQKGISPKKLQEPDAAHFEDDVEDFE